MEIPKFDILFRQISIMHFKQIIFLIAFAFMSLKGKAQANSNNDTTFLNLDNFLRDTLYIKSQFMECDEWGWTFRIIKNLFKRQ